MLKKMILDSELNAKHPLAGQNTQQSSCNSCDVTYGSPLNHFKIKTNQNKSFYLDQSNESLFLSLFSSQTVWLPAHREMPLQGQTIKSSNFQHFGSFWNKIVPVCLVSYKFGIFFSVCRIGPASKTQKDLDLRVLGSGCWLEAVKVSY